MAGGTAGRMEHIPPIPGMSSTITGTCLTVTDTLAPAGTVGMAVYVIRMMVLAIGIILIQHQMARWRVPAGTARIMGPRRFGM